MDTSTGTAVLARPQWSQLVRPGCAEAARPPGGDRPSMSSPPAVWSVSPESSVSSVSSVSSLSSSSSLSSRSSASGELSAEPGDPAGARTAAGARAMRRRRARLAADRRPPSGMVPSSLRGSAVVTADHGDEVDERSYPVGRWVRLACTLCFAATAVLVAVVLLTGGRTEAVGSVVVQPGDSLWSVAERAEPGADPRAVVDRIKELNGMQGDLVVAGAVLQVPVAGP